MLIKRVYLKGFKHVKEAGLSSIDATFGALVQIIIGTNGSGKSSFLSQLSLMPVAKSFYESTGIRIQEVETENGIFRLESTYEKASPVHTFYANDDPENLNVGKLAEAQIDLIREHIGVDEFVDDLIMNRFDFPKWKPAERQKFLMAINPDKIGFILQEIKQMGSAIRACKNNLSRLLDRKIVLERDLLNPEDLTKLEEEKHRIEDDLTFFQNQIMRLDVAEQVTASQPGDTTGFVTNTILNKIRTARQALALLGDVPRDDQVRDTELMELRNHKHFLEQSSQACETNISKIRSDLEELEMRYRELDNDGDLVEVEAAIGRLEVDLEKTRTGRPEFEISLKDLERFNDELHGIEVVLSEFMDCPIKLLPSRVRNRKEASLNRASYRNSRYEMTLGDLQSQLEELNKTSTIDPSDIPDAPCAKNACPLFSHFMLNYKTAESKRQNVLRKIAKIEWCSRRNSILLNGLQTYFENSRYYHEKIQWLVNESNKNPVLRSVLRGMDILNTLQNNARTISQRLRDAYTQIERWHTHQRIQQELETAYALRKRHMGNQDHDTVKLVVDIENLKKRWSGLTEDLATYSSELKALSGKIHRIENFNRIKQDVMQLRQFCDTYVKGLAKNHELSNITFLKSSISRLRSDAFMRMSEVERTLRAQSGLKERYDEEVVSQIAAIEKELSDRIEMEKAMINIPKELMMDFINGIFSQANLIIESVWTVPFRIEKLKYSDDLNYQFNVSGANESLREMNRCSEGQLEILSLAINLAIRMRLKYFNFPLCLDESGKTFDDKHRQNLAHFLNKLVEDRIISQLFFISHYATTHESFSNSQIFVLMEDNIPLPEIYNEHVVLT